MKQAMKDKISTIALQTAITFLKGITSLIQDEANKHTPVIPNKADEHAAAISVDELQFNGASGSTTTTPYGTSTVISKN